MLSSQLQRSKDQKYYKNWTKVTFFVYILALIFYGVIYTINIWFNFVFGSFSKHDHLFIFTILGISAKRWTKCGRISKQKLM